MPRPRNVQPAYLHHKPTNQAYVRIPTGDGGRKTVYLGAHGSPESKAEYRRLLAELDAVSPSAVSQIGTPTSLKTPRDILLSEMYRDFWKHAVQHYRRPDGSPTDQLCEFRQTFRIVLELYGSTLAREFGPLALKAVRQKMVESRVSRNVINDRCRRLKFVFKWAAGEELIPVSVYQALACVAGLQCGRTNARETEPVEPVDDAVVDATLRHLNRYVCGLVEFQRLTGCRPGEAMAVRRCDIDTGGTVWLYRPANHKTAWKGKTRTIAIGPKAQELLKGFFTDGADDYLFSPARYEAERLAERATSRKTPRWPSHLKRNGVKCVGANRKRPPRARYGRESYLNAIERACDRAFPLPADLAPKVTDGKKESRREWWGRLTDVERDRVKAWRKAHHWHPNRLRHTFATKVRRQFDLEAAQVLLGHERCDVTEVYAAKNTELATTIVAQIG